MSNEESGCRSQYEGGGEGVDGVWARGCKRWGARGARRHEEATYCDPLSNSRMRSTRSHSAPRIRYSTTCKERWR